MVCIGKRRKLQCHRVLSMRMSGMSRIEISRSLNLSVERVRNILFGAAYAGVFTMRVDGYIEHGDI